MRMIASKFPILDFDYDLFCVNDVYIHALCLRGVDKKSFVHSNIFPRPRLEKQEVN